MAMGKLLLHLHNIIQLGVNLFSFSINNDEGKKGVLLRSFNECYFRWLEQLIQPVVVRDFLTSRCRWNRSNLR